MSSQGGWGVPGMGSLVQTYETEILWGGDESKGLCLFGNCVYSGASRDAGNTPTTILRAGNLFGTVSSTGEREEWDATATDGTQDLSGILPNEQRAQDFDGNNADRLFRTLLRGPVKAAALLIRGSALVGHADEYLARRQLVRAGFILDDDPFGYKAGVNPRTQYHVASYQVLATENGTQFFAGAAATFTLPAIKAGLRYVFTNTTNTAMAIASTAGDDIVKIHDASADSITFSTASEMIGAQAEIWSEYVNGTLKWLSRLEPGFTATYAT